MLYALVIILLIWLAVLQTNHNELNAKFEHYCKYSRSRQRHEYICEKQSNPEKIVEPIGNLEKITEPRSNPEKIAEPIDKIPTRSSPLNCINDKTEIKSQTFSTPSDFNFEKVFMENIFNKIGALALIIGIGIFIKLISPYFIFTPPMQITIAFLAGLGMVLGAFKLHKNEMKNYAEVLSGTGFAILFIATYCAGSLHQLFSLPVTILVGFLLIMATIFVSKKFETFSTVAIGLFGGYLNPFFVNSDISSNFLFGYLIFLNIISIVYVQKNTNKIALNLINLALTTLTVSIFSSSNENVSLFYPLILWAIYLINDLVWISKKENATNDLQSPLTWLNYVALIWFANYIFQFNNNGAIGITVLATGVIYLFCAYYINKKSSAQCSVYLRGFLLSLLISTYFASAGTPRVCLWAIEAVAVSYIAVKFNLKEFEKWGLTFLFTSFIAIFFHENAVQVENIRNYIPILNSRTILFFVPILSAYSCSRILSKTNEQIAKFCKFLYITLIYLFTTFELNLILLKCNTDYSYGKNAVQTFCYLIMGFAYAINLKHLKEFSNNTIFKTAGYATYLISIVALIVASFSFNSYFSIPLLNIRFTAFVFAITASLLYNKKETSNIFEYAAIALGACLVQFEVSGMLQKTVIDNTNILFSTAWILYSGAIMFIGISKNIKSLKISGIWIILFTILKILFFDLNNVDPIYKTAAFILLGAILMAVSYFWVKNKKAN